uniref:28S ribosomal protein S11, mitochondrial-like n=1 Tax=Phallusia mammillata TaxID=59560 RepID=A0A6F9DKM0_9ASCI|nr:28S ribosomal protein S11, mitochondrial-like [Phallusia mammillata]
MLSRLLAANCINVGRRVIPLVESLVVPATRNCRSKHYDATQSFEERYINLNTDIRYEQVRNQAFDPIPLVQSTPKEGEFARSSAEFETRPNQVFGGVAYSRLPVVVILARWNNTIVTTYVDNKTICYMSCRKVGFKNAKKKTELAGETVGLEAAELCINKGCHKYVRVVVRGIGIGRKPAIRGLARGGMEIVSITDKTPITNESLPQRPRKIRRI